MRVFTSMPGMVLNPMASPLQLPYACMPLRFDLDLDTTQNRRAPRPLGLESLWANRNLETNGGPGALWFGSVVLLWPGALPEVRRLPLAGLRWMPLSLCSCPSELGCVRTPLRAQGFVCNLADEHILYTCTSPASRFKFVQALSQPCARAVYLRTISFSMVINNLRR